MSTQVRKSRPVILIVALCGWLLFAQSVARAADCVHEAIGAKYTSPTTRYAHGVLGDNIEYGELQVGIASSGGCQTASFTSSVKLPEDHVFEDIKPRLWDIDGDDSLEIVTIESSQHEGARLTIWSVKEGEVARLASTPYIGQAFRWLAPIGAADLDGDGYIEVAYIDRPHLAKTLRVWRFRDGELRLVDSLSGLTNHRIGDQTITSALQNCHEKPKLITANANWTQVMATTLEDGRLISHELHAYNSASDVLSPAACTD